MVLLQIRQLPQPKLKPKGDRVSNIITMKRKRNFYCEFQGDQCDDPRCKQGVCYSLYEEEMPEIFKTVTLKNTGHHLTDKEIGELIRDPELRGRYFLAVTAKRDRRKGTT